MLDLFFTISILSMVLAPVLLAALLRRRFSVPWYLFCVGVVTFTVSQAVHLPLNSWLADLGLLAKAGQANPPPLWQTSLVLGLTAGLCEELARAAGYAILRKRRALEDGIMLGIGHGGFESMIFGGVLTAATVGALLPLVGKDLSSLHLTEQQMAALNLQIQSLVAYPALAFAPLLERILAMSLHVVLSVMVLKAFQGRNPLWVALAIAYHAAVDASAVFVRQYNLTAWELEALLALVTLPGWIWLSWLIKGRSKAATLHTSPLRGEWAVFLAALRKELVQQWRTRHVLAVVAVFALFGMTSPLVAYFTPQLFKAIPGVEKFSSLIPTPTVVDAMSQYVKNISQFGFILAILIGMGAVAGEKERGTASLILSKPMTRWAFVSSKLVAQVVVYLLGFLIALVGAYFYTLVLFGNLDLGRFVLLNGLLFCWLLPFVSLTLAASVVGGSTGAAAGTALAASVLLLLLGNIPGYGQLTPGALIGWASQLFAGGTDAVQSNINNLVSNLIVLILRLVTGIAIFKQQEL